MAVDLAKRGITAIVHNTKSFAGYPKQELEGKLRGMPGGYHIGLPSIALIL